MTTQEKDVTGQKILIPLFIGIATIEGVLLYKLLQSDNSTALLLSIVLIAFLFILIPSMQDLKSLSIDKDGLKAELERVKDQSQENQEEIDELVFLSMGEDTYENLKKLGDGTYHGFVKKHHTGLEQELYYLRNLGYIRFKETETVKSIFDIPDEGSELPDYIEITENGRKYLAMREKVKDKNKA